MVKIVSNWKYFESDINQALYLKNESLMTLSNGYLGIRGSFEENTPFMGHNGTYINGFYEYHDLNYGEKFTGFPDQSQVMVNLPDPIGIKFTLNGHSFDIATGVIVNHNRVLNYHEGTLKRHIEWESPNGDRLDINSVRFVSSKNKHLAVIQYTVKSINCEGTFTFESGFKLDRHNISKEDDPRIGVHFTNPPLKITDIDAKDDYIKLRGRTNESDLEFRCAVSHTLDCASNLEKQVKEKENQVNHIMTGFIHTNELIVLTKYIWFDRCESNSSTDSLEQALSKGYDNIISEHKAYWKQQWEHMDIKILGDPKMQNAIRLNLFHLVQNVGKDGATNISAKGMTGEGYEGHYFWDTEIYMMPFYIYTNPDIAKHLLLYRYNTLANARARAEEMGHKNGVLYPWRTINGDECSSYFPAGTAQYHINSDIAYAIKQYHIATRDHKFMVKYGIEMLLELANLWLDLGVFDKNGRFCIHEVTGPDEYSCMVNNNAFTNLMVKDQLIYLVALLENNIKVVRDIQLIEKHGDHEIIISAHNRIVMDLLNNFDINKAKKAIANMVLPYDDDLLIYGQDDGFLSKAIWNFEDTPKENYPLLMHYHPLVLYRYQVCKQADVVLAQMLLPDIFSIEQKERDFNYYEKITTHDSSLSNCIYGVMAAELGNLEKSYNYYMKTATTDMDDVHHNAKDGVHAANMAGSWLGIVYGFAGFRVYGELPCFNPQIPMAWDAYEFMICIQGNKIKVTVDHFKICYELVEGDEQIIRHIQELIVLTKHEKIVKERDKGND